MAGHGWGANGSTLAPMVRPLVRAGIAVVLFDAASHGDSSGEAFSSLPRFAEDLTAVLDALRGHPAIDIGRIALLGHSAGAAAVLLHTACQGGVRAVCWKPPSQTCRSSRCASTRPRSRRVKAPAGGRL